jgi:hypothetical protein
MFVTRPRDRHTSNYNQIANFINWFGEKSGFSILPSIIAFKDNNIFMPF